MKIIFDKKGGFRYIHNDPVTVALKGIGKLRIARASNVEPTGDGRWTADMGPVGGPILGPFDTKGTALTEEVAWLEAHSIPVPKEV